MSFCTSLILYNILHSSAASINFIFFDLDVLYHLFLLMQKKYGSDTQCASSLWLHTTYTEVISVLHRAMKLTKQN